MSHDHSHEHAHSHSHSYGHTVPWGAAAAQWYEPGWSDPIRRHTIVSAELNGDDVILDASGDSTATIHAASAWIRQGRLVGVVSAEQLPAAREATAAHPDADKMTLIAGTPDAFSAEAGAASVVWSINAVSRWQDPARCVAALRDAMKPGGRLFIAADADACGIAGAAPDDPKPLKALLSSSGLRGVEIRRYRDGERRFLICKARRPWR